MTKKINLTVFKNNVGKGFVKGVAFMKCPYCKNEICLDIDKFSFCKTFKCRNKHKIAYILHKNSNYKEGFDKVLYFKVEDFKKSTLMELIK